MGGAPLHTCFLHEGIRDRAESRALDDATISIFATMAHARMKQLAAYENTNERQTEDDPDYPILEGLCWAEREVQPSASVKAKPCNTATSTVLDVDEL
jgi:hypothetical protein